MCKELPVPKAGHAYSSLLTDCTTGNLTNFSLYETRILNIKAKIRESEKCTETPQKITFKALCTEPKFNHLRENLPENI